MYENIFFLFFGLKLIICNTSFLLWTKYKKHFLDVLQLGEAALYNFQQSKS